MTRLSVNLNKIAVLRNSRGARKTFIRVQRRHPKLVFPLRRLMRRAVEGRTAAWLRVSLFSPEVWPRSPSWSVTGAARMSATALGKMTRIGQKRASGTPSS